MAQDTSPFDLLPDEIVVKIIYFVVEECANRRHNFVLNTIANISTRFRRLATDKSLWTGKLRFFANDKQKVELVIHGILNDKVTDLQLCGARKTKKEKILDVFIRQNDIFTLANKCPNLEELKMTRLKITRWPKLHLPLESLSILTVGSVSFHSFINVELHKSLPNLSNVSFVGSDGVATLPDMSRCEKLQNVCLNGGQYKFPDKIPFPSSLREIRGGGTIIGCSFESLHDYFEDCFISYMLEYRRKKRRKKKMYRPKKTEKKVLCWCCE